MNENDSAPPVPQTAREISKEWLDIIRGLRVELLSPAYDPQWKNGQTWILDELLRRLDEPLVAPSDPLENATQDVAAPSVGELEWEDAPGHTYTADEEAWKDTGERWAIWHVKDSDGPYCLSTLDGQSYVTIAERRTLAAAKSLANSLQRILSGAAE